MVPDVSIVIASYNAPDVLAACLHSVMASTRGVSYEIIVVDNASRDNNVARISSEFPDVRLVRNTVNRGFAAACNQGIGASTGNFILLLNPDTELKEDTISATAGFLRDRSDAGIAGCRLVFADGTEQESVGVFPNVCESFLGATFLSYLLPHKVLVGRHGIVRVDRTSAMRVDWLTGAFLLFKREVLDAIGALDEQFFMYTEETDFCYRAMQAGIGVWYVPGSTVIHHWAGMSSVSKRGMLWLIASQVLFLKKHYRGVERQVLLLLKYFGVMTRVPVNLVAGLATMNAVRLKKVWFGVYVVGRLLSKQWTYEKEVAGPVKPWTEVW